MAFGIEFLQFTKDEKNLLLKNLQLKTCVETVLILSWRTFFVGKYFKVFKAPKKWLFKWTVTFRDGAHAVVVHRKHASASKLPSCSVKRNPNLVSMLLRNRYRLCVRGGGGFYLYAIIITFNILASCEHQLLSFSLFTKYLVHFFCLSY